MPTFQLYAILESIADRVEIHNNVGQQRDNWNTLFLNSVNMITLTAATMAGFMATGDHGASDLGLKLASTLMFFAATGMLVLMNKIQPSQLVEEQRVMLEKFPESLEPTVWWPKMQSQKTNKEKYFKGKVESNGWSKELEMEMREVVEVIKRKDSEDYDIVGNKVLKMNKVLAASRPILIGIAALGSTFMDSSNGSWVAILEAAAGALSSAVNTLENGGQVGMVFEMYRNNVGFFKHVQESIESTLRESDWDKRENGELFEMKVALQLGRSLS
ncbi:Peroxisomal membrane 22 kDa (Mpv17/PMP22) family protein isoform 1 [Hibiscus syriacus]|uniref:Peroxisomal membrane 22 kDa (Mpv17/PMP22) family protein isoform 1 n=1 Tax=Hibiscus syriacus TaxID=106335 RepID=A0A6A2ZZC7_HIBSY|nr:Peroxisomal membrane 22 kDa (Mpv17/PMP22) family protein isoform 1 [Hibiscus syriacus]